MFREYHSKEELVDDLKASWNKRVKNYRVGGFVVGILMLIHAISDLQYTVNAYQAGAANWWTGALSGGVTLILALLILFRPVGSVMTLASFAGICLVVDGVSDLLMIHRIGDYF